MRSNEFDIDDQTESMMLQRVIRTEFYDDDNHKEAKPDISFAWIKAPGPGRISPDEIEGLNFNILPLSRTSQAVTPLDDIFENFLMSLINPSQISILLPRNILYSPPTKVVSVWADLIKSSDIILERSPPAAIPFTALLGQSTAIGIGTLIGGYAADGHALLLFVTVPAGVIIVGTAKGISAGLEKGLSKRIEKWLSPTQSRSRKGGSTKNN